MLTADIVNFIRNQWGCADEFCDINFSQKIWDELVDKAFEELKITNSQNKFCIRLVGQSGSGKTSQLLPSIQSALSKKQNFILFSVRTFVKYHPNLKKIKDKYGEEMLREKTNAFALSLLTLVFERCANFKLPILFEVTLLSPEYEKFIHEILIKNNYSCDYHCLAVSKNLSNEWIDLRCKKTNRIVQKSSSEFFYKILEPAIKYVQKINIKNNVFIWNVSDKMPIVTNLADDKLWDKIIKMRESKLPKLAFDEALLCKMSFYKKYYAKNLFE